MNPVFAIAYPWALYEREAIDGQPRRIVMDGSSGVLQAGHHPMLVAPAGTTMSIGERRMAEQEEGAPFRWCGARYSLRSLSVGVKPEERSIELTREDTNQTTWLCFEGQFARPQRTTGEPDDFILPVTELEGFLLSLVERLREIAEYVEGEKNPWEVIQDKWFELVQLKDPPMDLIVRHAQRYRRLVADVASRPRRVLSRRREMKFLTAVQEIDAKCIDWLVRQPGRTIAERAGPQQRILAVARYENLNTIENRVLRDFLSRSADAARLYARVNTGFEKRSRWRSVSTYGHECGRLSRELRTVNVGKPSLPITPNYVLQQDSRYRKIWRAYRELLKKIEEQDETWRWQRRLWADFCSLAVHISLAYLPDCERLSAATLRVAHEQARGRWSRVQDQAGLFLYGPRKRRGQNFVLSPIAITPGSRHPKIEEWQYSLGPTAVVHVEATENRGQASILIWAVHATGEPEEPLEDIVSSAQQSLETCLQKAEIEGDGKRVARGIVLRSLRSVDLEVVGCNNEKVGGISFGPAPSQVADGVERCGDYIGQAVQEMFP